MRTVELMIYKDFEMTQLWSENPFVVDFKGDKARVHNNVAFGVKKVSRFNKLNRFGGVIRGGTYLKSYYGLTVNGVRVYFKSMYSISK